MAEDDIRAKQRSGTVNGTTGGAVGAIHFHQTVLHGQVVQGQATSRSDPEQAHERTGTGPFQDKPRNGSGVNDDWRGDQKGGAAEIGVADGGQRNRLTGQGGGKRDMAGEASGDSRKDIAQGTGAAVCRGGDDGEEIVGHGEQRVVRGHDVIGQSIAGVGERRHGDGINPGWSIGTYGADSRGVNIQAGIEIADIEAAIRRHADGAGIGIVGGQAECGEEVSGTVEFEGLIGAERIGHKDTAGGIEGHSVRRLHGGGGEIEEPIAVVVIDQNLMQAGISQIDIPGGIHADAVRRLVIGGAGTVAADVGQNVAVGVGAHQATAVIDENGAGRFGREADRIVDQAETRAEGGGGASVFSKKSLSVFVALK